MAVVSVEMVVSSGSIVRFKNCQASENFHENTPRVLSTKPEAFSLPFKILFTRMMESLVVVFHLVCGFWPEFYIAKITYTLILYPERSMVYGGGDEGEGRVGWENGTWNVFFFSLVRFVNYVFFRRFSGWLGNVFESVFLRL